MSRVELIGLSLLAGLAIALVLGGAGRSTPAPDWPHHLPERSR